MAGAETQSIAIQNGIIRKVYEIIVSDDIAIMILHILDPAVCPEAKELGR